MAKAQNEATKQPDERQELEIYNAAEQGWIKPLDKSAYAGIVVERVHSMTEGTVIEGELLGRGQTLESIDEKTGEIRAIHTHRVKVHPQLTIAVLESYALRALRALPVGSRVRMIHQGFIRKGAKQIADVIVATIGSAPDGAKPDPRWSELPQGARS